jgi:DNA-binding MarR family transcriptional regulator
MPRQVLSDSAVDELLAATGKLLRRLRKESNPREFTWSQAAILGRLSRMGPMTTADLARAESVKPQSMGAALAVLESDGLVERRPHPTDGRQVLFGLTATGVEMRREHSLMKREWLATALAALSPQEQQILALAAPVIKRIAES